MVCLLTIDIRNPKFVAAYGSLNAMLFFYEVIQLYSVGIKDYFNFWNIIDLLRASLCLSWILVDVSDDINTHNWLTYWMIVANFIRGLSGFRAFDSTRFYVKLIIRATLDVVPFIIIFFYSTLSFGMLYWASGVVYRIDTFDAIWKTPMELSMGSFVNSNNPDLNFLYFMLCSVINVIIILNLLISVLGDSHDKFQADAIEIGSMEMIELIIEIETLMMWRRGKSRKRFIQVCDDVKFEGLTGEWEGKLKAISDIVNKSAKNTKKNFEMLFAKLQDIEKKIQVK